MKGFGSSLCVFTSVSTIECSNGFVTTEYGVNVFRC